MGKATLIISILIILFVGAVFVLKSRHANPSAMTYYQPTSSQTSTQVSPTPTSESTIPLTITAPTSATVSTSTVTVSGQTSPGADVFVNDTQLTANSQGVFSTIVTLDEGDNTIVIDVNDTTGNHAEKELTVTYTPNQ